MQLSQVTLREDTFSSLGTHDDRLGKILTDKENTEFKQLTGGIDIP